MRAMKNRLVIVGVLFAMGCGADGFQPSAPGGTPLNQLSAQQAQQLCKEDVSYEQAAFSEPQRLEYTCRALAIVSVLNLPATSTDAQLQAGCTATYELCKADPPTVTPSNPAVVCAAAASDIANCAATVSQYAACVNEAVDSVPRLVVPCSQVTKGKVVDLLASGPACTTLEGLCPDLNASALKTSSPLTQMKR